MERIPLTDGLTLATVLDRIAGGARLILTRDGVDVAALVRPDDLPDAGLGYLLEAFEVAKCPRCNPSASPHPHQRPQTP